jgi:hypothetical protein
MHLPRRLDLLKGGAAAAACKLRAHGAADLTRGRRLYACPRIGLDLRHGKIAITMEIYTEVVSSATREALRKLGDQLGP